MPLTALSTLDMSLYAHGLQISHMEGKGEARVIQLADPTAAFSVPSTVVSIWAWDLHCEDHTLLQERDSAQELLMHLSCICSMLSGRE